MPADPENTSERCWCDGSAFRPHPPGTDACQTTARPLAEQVLRDLGMPDA